MLAPPMTRVPMRVVYWGRWADSRGEVGPFSKTVVGWIEGGTHHVLGPRVSIKEEPKLLPMVESAEGGTQIECRMLVLEAQYQSYNNRTMILPPATLEAKGEHVREVRQLESAAG